jgi:putative membrane protein
MQLTLYSSIKVLHIAFMVTWFAGLFYLPRLFIYHAEAEDDLSRTRFTVMERRLFAIMTVGAVLTLVFGLALVWINAALVHQTWFQVKVILLIGLMIFHIRCWQWIGRLEAGFATKNTRAMRWFNEIPTFFLLTIIGLAILKPF